jgi:hypothetical protein
MNKGDEKNASGNALGSDTCHDSVRNPGEKHSLFEKRANGGVRVAAGKRMLPYQGVQAQRL